MLITRTRMQQLQQLHQSQQLQQPEGGALSLIPSCLGISGHPSGSRSGHPRYTGARSAGRPWVARSQFNTAMQSSIQQQHGAETPQTRRLVALCLIPLFVDYESTNFLKIGSLCDVCLCTNAFYLQPFASVGALIVP